MMAISTILYGVQLLPRILQIFLWYVFLVPAIIISFPMFLIWRLVAVLLINMQYDNPKFLSGYDVQFTLTENSKEKVILSCLEFKGKLDRDIIKQLLSNEFSSRYVRYRSYIVEKYNHFFWLEDNKFNIDNHVRVHPEIIKSKQEIMDVMQKACAVPLPPKTSPWFVDVYALDPKYDGGKGDETFFCIVCYFHHALADGFSLQANFFKALCGENDPDLSIVSSSQKRISVLQQVRGWLQLLLLFPYMLGDIFFSKTNVYDNLGENKRIIYRSNVLSFETAKRIKRALNVPLSHVLVSCACAGIQKHLIRNGITLPRNHVIAVNHSAWDVAEAIEPENKFVCRLFRVPIGSKNAKKRLLQLHRSLNSPLNLVRIYFSNFMSSCGGILLPSCIAKVLYNLLSPSMLITTNMRKEKVLALSGNGSVLYNFKALFPYPASIGFGVNWYTSGDELTLHLTIDESLGSAEERNAILNDMVNELTLLDKEIRRAE